jgi:hypothetical protein
VCLFTYDNRTFIVQNFQSQPVQTRVSVVGAATLRDLLNDKTLAPLPNSGVGAGESAHVWRGGGIAGNGGNLFEVPVSAHSFRVFAVQ